MQRSRKGIMDIISTRREAKDQRQAKADTIIFMIITGILDMELTDMELHGIAHRDTSPPMEDMCTMGIKAWEERLRNPSSYLASAGESVDGMLLMAWHKSTRNCRHDDSIQCTILDRELMCVVSYTIYFKSLISFMKSS